MATKTYRQAAKELLKRVKDPDWIFDDDPAFIAYRDDDAIHTAYITTSWDEELNPTREQFEEDMAKLLPNVPSEYLDERIVCDVIQIQKVGDDRGMVRMIVNYDF